MTQQEITIAIENANKALEELHQLSLDFFRKRKAWYNKWNSRYEWDDVSQEAFAKVWQSMQEDERLDYRCTEIIFHGQPTSAVEFLERYNNLDNVLAELDKEIEAINKENVQAPSRAMVHLLRITE